MNIFADENIPLITVRELRELGHDVMDIRGTQYEGITDEKIWEVVKKEQRLLITTDKGFSQKRYEKHSGILIISIFIQICDIITFLFQRVLTYQNLLEFNPKIADLSKVPMDVSTFVFFLGNVVNIGLFSNKNNDINLFNDGVIKKTFIDDKSNNQIIIEPITLSGIIKTLSNFKN